MVAISYGLALIALSRGDQPGADGAGRPSQHIDKVPQPAHPREPTLGYLTQPLVGSPILTVQMLGQGKGLAG